MFRYIFIAVLSALFLTVSASASTQLTLKEDSFDNLGLKNEKNNPFVFPTVLLYSTNGELISHIIGRDIYDLKSYRASHKNNNVKLEITSPSIKTLLNKIEFQKNNEKPILLYVDLIGMCPPCVTIKKKFKKNVYSTANAKFEIIFINVTLD